MRLRRRRKKTTNADSKMNATPPITMPAIAPPDNPSEEPPVSRFVLLFTLLQVALLPLSGFRMLCHVLCHGGGFVAGVILVSPELMDLMFGGKKSGPGACALVNRNTLSINLLARLPAQAIAFSIASSDQGMHPAGKHDRDETSLHFRAGKVYMENMRSEWIQEGSPL